MRSTYNGDVIDVCVPEQQQPSTVGVVALDGHVQRTESVLGLRHDWSLSVKQKVDNLIVTASGGAV